MSFDKSEDDEINISFIFGIILIGCLLGLYGVVYSVDSALPTPLQIADEATNLDAFIAERARNYLKPLTDLGPRITGDEVNEIDTVNYLIGEIKAIINQKHPIQEIEWDVQVVSGSYYLDYKPYGSISAYANVQNIVVKMHADVKSNHSVILNTHYDTVPTSPGGSDDGLNVAVAMEVFRKMVAAPTRPKNNLIFLFNGAEEPGLIASHGFITKHKWAPEVRVLVNLEATGGGGREILFQTGPDKSWLMKYYYDVPHPHGNVAAEEVFQSNIIPSDTDFRNFRDYGGVIGYDFAYSRDGYRYHTKYDGFENIEFGRFQHTGDNVLKLMRNLADAPEVSKSATEQDGQHVFFDYLGWFFVMYDAEVAIYINCVTVLVSIALTVWSYYDFKLGLSGASFRYMSLTSLSILLGWIFGFIVAALVALILDASHRTMSWYSVHTLIIGSYVAPTVLCLCLSALVVNKYVSHPKLSITNRVMMQIHLMRTIWAIVVLVGTCLELRLTYIILVPLMFNTVAMILIQGFKLYMFNKFWPVIYLLSTILPTMLVMYIIVEMLGLFIPICGRFGSSTNPEFIVGVLSTLLSVLIVSFYIPLFAYVREPWYIIITLGAVFIAGIIVTFTPVGFPYTFNEDSPRLGRFSIYHTQRTFRDENNVIIKSDAGFYFSHMDRNSQHSIDGIVKSLEKQVDLDKDCELAIACGMPVTNSRSLKSLQDSVWIPAEKPKFKSDITYSYTAEEISPTKTQYSFTVEGSDRINIYLSPRKQIDILSVNLADELPENYVTWNDQPVYFISFVYGKDAAPLMLDFIIQKPEGWDSPTVDLAISAKFIHDNQNDKTTEYENFLSEFPEWTIHTTMALAYYESIVLS